jgi:hypothetical protein
VSANCSSHPYVMCSDTGSSWTEAAAGCGRRVLVLNSRLVTDLVWGGTFFPIPQYRGNTTLASVAPCANQSKARHSGWLYMPPGGACVDQFGPVTAAGVGQPEVYCQ